MEPIYAIISGGLGNMLFNVAHAESISQEEKRPVKYFISGEGYRYRSGSMKDFVKANDLENTIFRKIHIEEDLPPADIPKTTFRNYLRHPGKFHGAVILDNCYPSSKGFISRQFIQELFAMEDGTAARLSAEYGDILSRNDLCTIHIRRGDFLKYPGKYVNLADDTDYYERAVNLAGRDRTFLVISDDPEYCRRKFNSPSFHFAAGNNALTDLYLLTRCRTNIIGNSTFGWWGAYLNTNPGHEVISPKQWWKNGSKWWKDPVGWWKDKQAEKDVKESWWTLI